MDTCPLCFDSMDMLGYLDERQATATCFKLECNHSFHTKCIIDCLSKSEHKCPSCNKYKSAEHKMTEAGLAQIFLREIKNDVDVKYAVSEYKSALTELKETYKQLNDDVNEYAKKRCEELHFYKKRQYVNDCVTAVKAEVRASAKTKGPRYVAALHYGSSWERERRFIETFIGSRRLHSRWRFTYIRLKI